MPRNHNPGTSTLRNRNRVTNKTRLRIVLGTVDADPLVLNEDDEKARLISNTAGVDAEDANEHHLQAVLSAASQQHNGQRSTRGSAAEKAAAAPAAYIPVPDSGGVIDNYDEYYPSERWRDPATYVRSSETVEEGCENALNNHFTYYMDERDQEWLEKNNEEARGEGTSAQGAVSSSGTTTRSASGSRSAKAKGKEPDVLQPMVITDDEFELVMGIFEKTTHEKTEFLHHGLEQGMAFPPFSDYQETFSSPLPPATFATYTIPEWIPTPASLLRIARAVCPHWRERRIERGGHRIIPALNFDETDTGNESYICFRRREIKAVRKTRASQATSSDKLIRLQTELQTVLELSNDILVREKLKQDAIQHIQVIWEKRLEMADLKRKFPSLGVKEDEELLHDKERVPKRPKLEAISRVKRTRDSDLTSPVAHAEVQMRPKERSALIQSTVDRNLQQLKERDHHWDDQVDNLYQASPATYAQRHYKYIDCPAPTSLLFASAEDEERVGPRAVRLRNGRNGFVWLDRRGAALRVPSLSDNSDAVFLRRRLQDQDEYEDPDFLLRRDERWRYDADDNPPVGPDGADEQDRILVDDFDPRFMRYSVSIYQDQDHQALSTDPSILVLTPDGRQQSVIPIRQPTIQRLPVPPRPTRASPSNGIALSLPPQNVTPVSMLKKMQPPPSLPQVRISSNGGMPPPTPMASANPSTLPINGHNVDQDMKPNVSVNPPIPKESTPAQPESTATPSNNSALVQGNSPVRPKSQNQQHPAISNGYHMTYPAMANGSPYQHNGLSIQQMQNIKTAFAVPPGTDIHSNAARGIPASYMGHVVTNGTNFNMQIGVGTNMNLKLPPPRQIPWTAVASPLQRPMSVDTNASMSPSPNLAPARAPSANGTRRTSGGMVPSVGHVVGPGPGQHQMSPHLQHSPSPMPLSQSHSSPSHLTSPSLQHQQPVGSSQGGY